MVTLSCQKAVNFNRNRRKVVLYIPLANIAPSNIFCMLNFFCNVTLVTFGLYLWKIDFCSSFNVYEYF